MILLNGSSLTIDQLVATLTRGETVAIEAAGAHRVRAARESMAAALKAARSNARARSRTLARTDA